MRAGFVWDDDRYVTNNPLLTAPGGFYRIWFSTDVPSQYFPVVYSTFWLEHQLWGFEPVGYHVTNILLHIVNALLLWLVLRRLSVPGAWFASMIFALHPVHAESVAWIAERKNVLMLFFSLLSVLYWMKFALGGSSGRRAIVFYVASILFFALALLSKTTACTIVAAPILILWFKRVPFTAKRWLEMMPYVAGGLVMGFVTIWWEKHYQGTGFVDFGWSLTEKLLIACRALWFYIGKLVFPFKLTFSYPMWRVDPQEASQYIWIAAIIVAAVVMWVLRKRVGRGAIAAMVFFVVTLFPMLGFFPLYTFVYSLVADHYQYVASIGPIVLFGAAASRVLRSWKNDKRILMLLAGLILLELGVLSWRQSRIYANEQTLWQDTLRKNPNSWLALSHICDILCEHGKFDEAQAYIERAIELADYMGQIHPRGFADLQTKLAAVLEA